MSGNQAVLAVVLLGGAFLLGMDIGAEQHRTTLRVIEPQSCITPGALKQTMMRYRRDLTPAQKMPRL